MKSIRSRDCWLLVIANLVVFLFVLTFIEAAIAFFLRHPPPHQFALRVISSYYVQHDRRIIQALPECAIYDPETTYILRPGSCSFSNREFSTSVNVNSAGLRDDEASLLGPEIIALGDSVAMGWGVHAGETYAKKIQALCGVKVLNAGISSYATVRSLRLLGRLDLSNVRAILLQYSDNDFGENAAFFSQDNTLEIAPRSRYEEIQRDHIQRGRYFPGKHTLRFVPFALTRTLSRLPSTNGAGVVAQKSSQGEESNAELHAKYFLNALVHSTNIPDGIPILIFEINGRGKNSREFTSSLRTLVESTELPPDLGPLIIIDMDDGLTYDKFFVLDEHINAHGHNYVALRLFEAGVCEI